jgi:uncharacterized protein
MRRTAHASTIISLFSPALAAAMSPQAPASPMRPVTATDLVALLDEAGIERAVVLSTAYIFEQPSREIDSAADKVRADNEWTSVQVAQYPSRLIGFCGVNPLKDYALDELARCAKDRYLRNGLKLHFGNSVVDCHNAQHIEQLKRVLHAANGYRMPIVVHMRASFTAKLPYGRDEALIFLNELVPAAPDVVIQIAHLAAAGAPSDPGADQALEVFIDAIARGDSRATRLYFDAPSVARPTSHPTCADARGGAARSWRSETRPVVRRGRSGPLPRSGRTPCLERGDPRRRRG